MILKFACRKEFLLWHRPPSCSLPLHHCSSVNLGLQASSQWESQWSRTKPQRYTPYAIHFGFFLSNLYRFCSDLSLTIQAGSPETCSHRDLRWVTPCSRKLSHAPGRRGCTKRCRDEISQALTPQRQHLAVLPKGWWQRRIALNCSVLNKQSQSSGRDLSPRALTPGQVYSNSVSSMSMQPGCRAMLSCVLPLHHQLS